MHVNIALLPKDCGSILILHAQNCKIYNSKSITGYITLAIGDCNIIAFRRGGMVVFSVITVWFCTVVFSLCGSGAAAVVNRSSFFYMYYCYKHALTYIILSCFVPRCGFCCQCLLFHCRK